MNKREDRGQRASTRLKENINAARAGDSASTSALNSHMDQGSIKGPRGLPGLLAAVPGRP